ncbi:MAG: hypothetical protein IT514_10200 [Burkholderiales bacterium]|nr:hypothetical protein [Burkholderiales bacterium]
MSDLQIALLVIGVAVIAAVFGFNKWQEARFRREASSQLAAPAEDVLLREGGANRMEPTLSEGAPAPTPASAARQAPLSERLDAILELSFEEPRAGREIAEGVAAAALDPRRPLRIEGQAQGAWESLDPQHLYVRARLGVQLVDRRGAATREQLLAFAQAAEQAAAALKCAATAPDLEAVLARAAQLDRFCGEVDIQVAVHVVSEGTAFPGTRIRALAESAGLALGEGGRYWFRDEAGRALFSLGSGEAVQFRPEGMRDLSTSTLVLELDVPRAPAEASFERFRNIARHLADGLEARLVDDNQAVLGDAAFTAIAEQLASVYQAMQDQEIPAGGPLALRLFS